MRAQAALDYAATSLYNTTVGTAITCTVTSAGVFTPAPCTGPLFGDTTVQSAMSQAASNSGSTTYGATDTTGQLYAIETQLKSVPGDYWCVDSSGKSEEKTGTAASATACP